MTTPPAILQTWLWYADIGVPVVPEHSPSGDPQKPCDCRKADCTKPAKHPRTAKGSLDATTNPETLERWAGMWPHANTGTDAGLAGLVIIAPDSPEWDAEFQRRGLNGAAVVQSGGGEGHKQYWFRRSPRCPKVRICKSGQYDILSNGNVVIPPSLHVSGNTYVWLESPVSLADLPEEPEWALVELLEADRRAPAAAELDEAPDAPPVRYQSDRARRRWRGELVEPKRDDRGNPIPGSVDRSESLFFIGLDLAEANAGQRTIVQALEERDRALGWNVFADRKDAATRYAVIAVKAVAYAEQKKAESTTDDALITVVPPTNGNGHHPETATEGENLVCRPAADWEQIEALRHENTDLRRGYARIGAVLRNKRLVGSKKLVALVATFEVVSMDSRNLKDRRLYTAAIAEKAGVSKSAAGDAMTVLSGPGGVFEREERWEKTNPYTGEIHDQPHRILEYRPRLGSVGETLAKLAEFQPEAPPGKSTWGGKREPRCPEHPRAGSIVRCRQCDKALANAAPALSAEQMPSSQDDFMAKPPPPPPAPHGGVPLRGQDDFIGGAAGERAHEKDLAERAFNLASVLGFPQLMASDGRTKLVAQGEWAWAAVRRAAPSQTIRLIFDRIRAAPPLWDMAAPAHNQEGG